MHQHVLHKLEIIIVIFIFSVAIYAPFFLGIFEKDKDVSEVEKRAFAKLPQIDLSLDGISGFPKLFDAYYADHFGLRESLVEYYKLAKFNLGDSPSSNVTLGKDGWLFLGSIKKGYKNYDDPIGDARNVNLFTDHDLKKFAKHMASLDAWLSSRGIKYVFVIAPNKHTVYFEHLPGYITKFNKKSSTDQLVEYLNQHTNVIVIDLRKKLIESKAKYRLYSKTDTHWNHFGANIAQFEIMLRIEQIFPNLIKPELFKMREGISGGGDLARFVGVNGFSELNPQPMFENTCKPIRYPESINERKPHSYSCEGQEIKALIYRDSFFNYLQPYFARKFKHSTYIWEKTTYSSLEKYVTLKNPDIVIEEWVERFLPTVPSPEPQFNAELNKLLLTCSNDRIFFNNFDALKFNPHINHKGITKESLLIESMGKDPIIYFPALLIETDKQYIAHIEMKSDVKSTLTLYYSDREVEGQPFSEANSVKVNINPGRNDIYIPLDYQKLGNRLRLDPISGVGEIEIETIDIRGIDVEQTKVCNQTTN